MKHIEVSLNLGTVARLLDFIKPILKQLETETAFPTEMDAADREFDGVWREGLIHSQREDCRKLMALFNAEFFNSGQIVLDESNADSILRATAAIRAKLRQYPLRRFSEIALDVTEVDLATLTADERIAYDSLMFLRQLQLVIIDHLGK